MVIIDKDDYYFIFIIFIFAICYDYYCINIVFSH